MPPETPRDSVPIVIRSRIISINAEKFADIPISGLNIDVRFESVAANNQFLEVRFTYVANYKENVGRIEMKGVVVVEMDPAEVTAIANLWATQHRLADDFASSVLNNIHYKCGTEAILPAKVIELPAPILPQRIGVTTPGGTPVSVTPPAPPSPSRPSPYAPKAAPQPPSPGAPRPRPPSIPPSSIKRY